MATVNPDTIKNAAYCKSIIERHLATVFIPAEVGGDCYASVLHVFLLAIERLVQLEKLGCNYAITSYMTRLHQRTTPRALGIFACNSRGTVQEILAYSLMRR